MKRTLIQLTDKQIKEKIPYELIAETVYGMRWNTGKRRRLWLQYFTIKERQYAAQLWKKAYLWHCVTGVPDDILISPETLVLWNKLGAFCASL